MKKIISLALALMMIVCVFASCGGSNRNGDVAKVTLKFVADGKEIYSKEIEAKGLVAGEGVTVIDAVECFMDTYDDIEIFLDSEDAPTTIKGVKMGDKNYEEGERFWDFKIGDDDYGAQNGKANTVKVKNGDVITWGFMSVAEFDALEIKQANVTLKFVTADGEIYSEEITAFGSAPKAPVTVIDAVVSFAAANEDALVYFDDEEAPSDVAGVDDYITDEDDTGRYWNFKKGEDGTFDDTADASKVKIADGDVIIWNYMTADEFKTGEFVVEETEETEETTDPEAAEVVAE